MAGIKSYGLYVPAARISFTEIRKAQSQVQNNGIREKSVAGADEDSFTMAVEAGLQALANGGIAPGDVCFLGIASTSFPYSEKTQAGAVLTALGLPLNSTVMEFTNSPRSATSALLAACAYLGCVEDNKVALVIAADMPKGNSRSNSEYRAGAAAAALVLSKNDFLAEITGWASFAGEFPGISFKRQDAPYPSEFEMAGYEEGAFLEVAGGAVKELLAKTGTAIANYNFLAVQQPDARLPERLARKLKAQPAKTVTLPVAVDLGDLGSASCLTALLKSMAQAGVGQKILLVSYGGGSAADALALTMAQNGNTISLHDKSGTYIDFVSYLKIRQFL